MPNDSRGKDWPVTEDVAAPPHDRHPQQAPAGQGHGAAPPHDRHRPHDRHMRIGVAERGLPDSPDPPDPASPTPDRAWRRVMTGRRRAPGGLPERLTPGAVASVVQGGLIGQIALRAVAAVAHSGPTRPIGPWGVAHVVRPVRLDRQALCRVASVVHAGRPWSVGRSAEDLAWLNWVSSGCGRSPGLSRHRRGRRRTCNGPHGGAIRPGCRCRPRCSSRGR